MARSGAGKGVGAALQEAVSILTASYEGVRLEVSVPAHSRLGKERAAILGSL